MGSIKFKPIYKGFYNAVPEDYTRYQNAVAYSMECEERRERRRYIISTSIEFAVLITVAVIVNIIL